MSVSVYARAIIGVQLPRPPFEEINERGCEHPLSTGKFCSKCGAKSWNIESKPLFDDEVDDPKIDNFVLLQGGCHDSDEYYLGICNAETEDCMYVSGGVFAGDLSEVDITLLTSQLKSLLKPMDLWNDHMRVGLWVFGFVS